MFDKILKIIWILLGTVFVLAMVSTFFGPFLLVTLILFMLVIIGLLVRRNNELHARQRETQRDLDRARNRWL